MLVFQGPKTKHDSVLRRDRKGLPDCPVVKTLSLSAGSEDSVLSWEAKIPCLRSQETKT